MGEKAELKQSVDLFIRGEFYCSRKPGSQLHDYVAIKHLALGTNVDGRTDEFFVYHTDPAQVVEFIDKQDIKDDYWITVFSNEKPNGFEAEGYTIYSKEFLMQLDLDNWSTKIENKTIRRINSEEEARHINQYFGRAAVDLEKFQDPNIHYYVGEENGKFASYGRYVLVDDSVCFLSDIFTSKIHRGKGLATAICQRMLFDARGEGAVKSILASSQMGHPLYLRLGYHDVSKMWVFKK